MGGEEHTIGCAPRHGPSDPGGKLDHVVSGHCGLGCGAIWPGGGVGGKGDDVAVHGGLPGNWTKAARSGLDAVTTFRNAGFRQGLNGPGGLAARAMIVADAFILVVESGVKCAELWRNRVKIRGIYS